MDMGSDNIIYWLKNQIAIVYTARGISPSTPPQVLAKKITGYRQQLNKDVLDSLGFHLEPLKQQAGASSNSQDDGLDGVYLFAPPETSTGGIVNPTTAAIFYRIEPNKMTGTTSMGGDNGTGAMGADDVTLTIVNELNKHKDALQSLDVLEFDALPHWLHAGTPDGTHGCPVNPPIQIQKLPKSGQLKTSFQDIDLSLQGKTGKGVTVFVLDTLPQQEQILQAAKTAGDSNILLQDIVQRINARQIKPQYWEVPRPSDLAVTGKDVYGRLAGFPLVDHGLFITGIIQELAPEATIECIRVLNDYGVGTLQTLINALKYINNRMVKLDNQTGDLYQKSVIINLSLVIGPPESDLARLGLDRASLQSDLQGLSKIFHNLAEAGAVCTASAGNDTDPRDYMMNPREVRFWTRYPAMFAYDDPPNPNIIPVGAVNNHGIATAYSNYPGPQGIGAYGGELPEPTPWIPSGMSHVNVTVDEDKIDAIRGVYSSPAYPALSKNDHGEMSSPVGNYPEYQSSGMGWVYWVGTSFATPIISALAARVMEGQPPSLSKNADAREKVRAATKDTTTWTGVEDGEGMKGGDINGPAVMVRQKWE